MGIPPLLLQGCISAVAVNVLEPCKRFGSGMCLLALRHACDAQGHVHGPHAVIHLHLALGRGIVRVEECCGLCYPHHRLATALHVVGEMLWHRNSEHLLGFGSMGLRRRLPHSTVASSTGVAALSSSSVEGCTAAAAG